ncbi:MAG: hypothetical protein NTW55_03535 [Planctomycetota bacterium]|nr:hypothetical protein [Planctomycetota bacterium]
MNRLQKIACYNLVVIFAVITIVSVVFAVLYHIYGLPYARRSLCMFGLFGLMGLSAILFRAKPGKVDFDERDLLIQRKSTTIAYSVFWVLWIAGSMITWAIKGAENQISANILPIMVVLGGLTVVLVQSVAILSLYDRGVKGEKS